MEPIERAERIELSLEELDTLTHLYDEADGIERPLRLGEGESEGLIQPLRCRHPLMSHISRASIERLEGLGLIDGYATGRWRFYRITRAGVVQVYLAGRGGR
jgi:hypothetical protein